MTGERTIDVRWGSTELIRATHLIGNLSASMDVFNLLNGDAVLGRETSYTATRATFVNEIMAPRVIRFGVRMRF